MYEYNCCQIDDEGFLFKSDILERRPLMSRLIKNLSVEHDNVVQNTDGYKFPHSVIASLGREMLDALELPPAYPYFIEIKTTNNLASQSLRYQLTYLWYAGAPIVNPKRTGCLLRITEEDIYLLTKDLFFLVEEIHHFNEIPLEKRTQYDNIRYLAEVKSLSDSTRVSLDKICREANVIEPRKLAIQLKQESDGSISVYPRLVDNEFDYRDGKSASDINSDFCNRYSRQRKIGNVVKCNNNYILLNDKQKNALNELKTTGNVKKEARDDFVKAPESILDAEVFELENFSERVKELGLYKPRVFPFLKPFKEEWIPPECGLMIDEIPVGLKREDIERLIPAIESAIAKGEFSVQSDSGSIPADPEVLDALKILLKETKSCESSDKQSGHRLTEPDRRVLIIYDNIEQINFLPDKSEETRDFSAVRPVSLKKEVRLLPHQEKGFLWLTESWRRRYKGALLADDMGLGKTLQGLLFLAFVKESMTRHLIAKKSFLVVAPVALIDNWINEYNRFFNTDLFGEPFAMHGKSLSLYKHNKTLLLDKIPDGSLVLTTYETLRDHQISFAAVNWAVIILDEAQKIKTPSARMTDAAKAMKYDFGLCMTGTPVENSWVDLWSIFDFALPGVLGCLKDFNAKYQLPLTKKETDLTVLGRSLQKSVAPYMLRRLKTDVCEGLPHKYEHPCRREMPDSQIQAYMNVIYNGKIRLKNAETKERREQILKTLFAIRDVSLHKDGATASLAGFETMPVDDIINGSARMMATVDILQTVREKDEKAIIFLLSRKMQYIVQKVLSSKFGINVMSPINGMIMGSKRLEIIDDFQRQPGFQVLILSPEAAGVGLNITAANHVIHLSRLWNPAKEDQATDRSYRIGQHKDVHVYYPMAVHPRLGDGGSFDEKLDRLLSQKRQLSYNVLVPPAPDEDVEYGLGMSLLDETGQTARVPESALTLEEVDRLSGLDFERYITMVYRKQGYEAKLTPVVNDYGADVLIMPSDKNTKGLLIQCKHVNNPNKAVGPEGVHEICSSLNVYRIKEGVEFHGIVVTNALTFTANAIQSAQANSIEIYNREQIRRYINEIHVTASDLYSV